MAITLSLSAYRVFATHMATGQQAVFEVTALDGGEALEKVECQCVWAVDNFELIDPTECVDTGEYLAAMPRPAPSQAIQDQAEAIATDVANRCHGKRKVGQAPQRYAIIWQAARLGAIDALTKATL